MAQLPTIYLRQAGLTCGSKFCYLYPVWCMGQGAVSNSRPIANINVSSKKLNAAKHNSVYTLKKFYFKTNRAFALKE
jgi:hypothetical protein